MLRNILSTFSKSGLFSRKKTPAYVFGREKNIETENNEDKNEDSIELDHNDYLRLDIYQSIHALVKRYSNLKLIKDNEEYIFFKTLMKNENLIKIANREEALAKDDSPFSEFDIWISRPTYPEITKIRSFIEQFDEFYCNRKGLYQKKLSIHSTPLYELINGDFSILDQVVICNNELLDFQNKIPDPEDFKLLIIKIKEPLVQGAFFEKIKEKLIEEEKETDGEIWIIRTIKLLEALTELPNSKIKHLDIKNINSFLSIDNLVNLAFDQSIEPPNRKQKLIEYLQSLPGSTFEPKEDGSYILSKTQNNSTMHRQHGYLIAMINQAILLNIRDIYRSILQARQSK